MLKGTRQRHSFSPALEKTAKYSSETVKFTANVKLLSLNPSRLPAAQRSSASLDPNVPIAKHEKKKISKSTQICPTGLTNTSLRQSLLPSLREEPKHGINFKISVLCLNICLFLPQNRPKATAAREPNRSAKQPTNSESFSTNLLPPEKWVPHGAVRTRTLTPGEAAAPQPEEPPRNPAPQPGPAAPLPASSLGPPRQKPNTTQPTRQDQPMSTG